MKSKPQKPAFILLSLILLAGCAGPGAIPSAPPSVPASLPAASSIPPAPPAGSDDSQSLAGAGTSRAATGSKAGEPGAARPAGSTAPIASAAIDEIFWVLGDTATLLAANVQTGDSLAFTWPAAGREQTGPEDFTAQEAPCFRLVVAGREIPVTTARLVTSGPRDELVFSFNTIAFFQDGDGWFFSPQPDYPSLKEDAPTDTVRAHYLYLPQVRRWMRRHEGQHLFAVGLSEAAIRAYFPHYTGDIPWVIRAAIVCSETVSLEDVHTELSGDWLDVVTEVRSSDTLRTFTPNDVMVVAVDHVWGPALYYRYRDNAGGIRRQYICNQFKDGNNGGIVNLMLTPDDPYYTLIEAD